MDDCGGVLQVEKGRAGSGAVTPPHLKRGRGTRQRNFRGRPIRSESARSLSAASQADPALPVLGPQPGQRERK